MSAAANVLTIFLSFLPSTGGLEGMTDAASFGKPWTCPYSANADECQTALVVELDRIFSDFDIRFTLERPAGEDFRTVLFTNDTPQSWSLDARIAGITMSKSCDGRQKAAAVIFDCSSTALCAKHTAHEIGHMLGLTHVFNPADIMYPIDSGAPVFRNESLASFGDDPKRCRKFQNSYALLMKRIGPRGSGLEASRTIHKKRRRR